jgi:hypothetical protein
MFPIHEVTAVELAFPANVVEFMPQWEDIPDEFKHGSTKENELVCQWFFRGVKHFRLTPREGVDGNKALDHIQMILGSFEPKHEHKEAACAFLFREWFSSIDYDKINK